MKLYCDDGSTNVKLAWLVDILPRLKAEDSYSVQTEA